MGNILDFVLSLGQLMAAHGVSRAELDEVLRHRNGKACPAKAPVRVEASDVEQTMTAPRRYSRQLATIEAPAESRDYRTLIDHDNEPIDYDKPALPGLEGAIKPVKAKSVVRVKHDTQINKVRFWLLNLPKNTIITSQQLKKAFNLEDGNTCWVVHTLLKDRVMRRKRNITGKFKKGTFVKLGKTADAALKRRLRGKRVS